METTALPDLTQQMQCMLQRGDSSQAIALGDQLFVALPQDPPVTLLRRSALHQVVGADHRWPGLPDPDSDPETRLSSAWAILGLAQFSLHRFNDADLSLRQALSADPNNPFALATMAVLLHQRRQDNKAIALTRLIEDVPGTSELVDEIRQASRQRQIARQVVERNAYLEPQRTPGFSIWVWLLVLLVMAGVAAILFQPGTPLGYALCLGIPLVFVLILRSLFS